MRFAEFADGEVQILLEVINSDWLVLCEDGQDACYWPPDSFTLIQKTSLVKKRAPADETWSLYPCEVLKYYGEFTCNKQGRSILFCNKQTNQKNKNTVKRTVVVQ